MVLVIRPVDQFSNSMRVHVETDYPKPNREAAHTFKIGGPAAQALLQLTNDSIQVSNMHNFMMLIQPVARYFFEPWRYTVRRWNTPGQR